MKKRDFILIFSILFISVLLWLIPLFHSQVKSGRLVINVDHKQYGIYELVDNQKIVINDTNICEIKDGKVFMTYGECPDQVCVHSLAISKTGQTIICMPNKVVLEIKDSEESNVDTMVE